jgi:hypothetical protein
VLPKFGVKQTGAAGMEATHQTTEVRADIDFDSEGRVVRNVSNRTSTDPVLHAIVQKMLRGEQLTLAERHYFSRLAPRVVESPRRAA